MLKQWLFYLRNISRRLSVRSGLFAILAIISSLAGVLLDEYVPDKFADLVGGEAVYNILTVMASSMLMVATFALSTIVAAYSSATQNATPRATRLIIEDSESHSAISIFLGAFIYSIVSLIALSTDYYGEKGRVILLILTVAVLTSVVWIIIRWVDELKDMGSVHETILRVEKATSRAMKERGKRPTFGCRPMVEIPVDARAIRSKKIGYVQNIDIDSLSALAKAENLEFYVEKDVGKFVHLHSNLISVRYLKNDGALESIENKIHSAFAIGSNRTFNNDPLYGISVLSGIGIKALSPSLNDPGTAIDVISSLVRVLTTWQAEECRIENDRPEHSMIFFPKIPATALINEAFYHFTIDGVKDLQVTMKMKEALEILTLEDDNEFSKAAYEQIYLLNSRAKNHFQFPEDLKRVKTINNQQEYSPFGKEHH